MAGFETSYLAAFLVGLMGGVHCLGMCGGIVAALSFGGQGKNPQGADINQWGLLFGYNLGRLFSYTIAGALAGLLGVLALDLTGMQNARLVLQVIAALFLLALGLYLGGWWMGLVRVEKVGAFLWKYLEPLRSKLIPVNNTTEAFGLGIVWGWLPCGLIYSVLIWCLASGSVIDGAIIMLSFGLGTLPNLLLMGIFVNQLNRVIATPWVRQVAGGLIILLALLQLYQAFAMGAPVEAVTPVPNV